MLTLEELTDALSEMDAADDVRAVVLTGAGDRAFVAGADITEMAEMDVQRARAFAELGQKMLRFIGTTPKPVFAAVNGYALGGGCELAMACDVIYASENAKLGQPEVNLGVIPGFGGTQRLARLVGPARAKELCMTGDVLSAQEALRIGLVNAVMPAGDLLPKVRATAAKIAQKGPLAVAEVKRVISEGLDGTLDAGCTLERHAFAWLFATQDQKEGMRAFLEKRTPVWKGK
jgi:enoyl-CoA hydratase